MKSEKIKHGDDESAMTHPKWIKLKKYVDLTGDTAAAVHARRRTRKWSEGKHCKIVDDALWVNLAAVTSWLDSWN